MAALAALLAASQALAGNAYDQSSTQPDARQKLLFQVVILSAGSQCSSVSRIFFRGEMPSIDAGGWAVRCPEGDYSVSVGNSGSMETRVLDCVTMKMLTGQCWEPF
ncbi:hypothetical protein [Mesorhizobium sp. WSM3868]|uniref:hypothetical protein n=1 Tax=Mesorhizobium sp. WSM3868 TaxID=2029405 RepID=UPI001180F197|nr:hypothetical protein [Mesorhizobium sp. WSM3868]